mmetsp:Transcript_77906/g.167137  ORF Transcript_77906/g.167137 Transcript_77906/m.167137 type:complete len:431 (-) Transcript_77906:76-1368(-)
MDTFVFWPLLAACVLASSSISTDDATSNGLHAEECRDDCDSNVMLLQRGFTFGLTEEGRIRAAAEIEGRRDDCEEEPSLIQAFQFLDSTNTSLDPSFIKGNPPPCGIRFSIRGHNLTWNRTTDFWPDANEQIVQNYANMFSEIVSQHALPDMDFLVGYMDNVIGAPGVFLSEGNVGRDLLTLPRSFILGKSTEAIALSAGSHRAGTGQAGVANVYNPPQCTGERKNLAVFRGSTTGVTMFPIVWKDGGNNLPLRDFYGDPVPRYEIALLSKRRPDLLDAGFTSVTRNFDPLEKWEDALRQEGLMKNLSTYEEQSCYSVILVVDGHTLADRLAEQMSWGLPVVLIRNRANPDTGGPLNEEFWYPDLVSWKNYVLATPDTLETVLETLLADADLRRQIGESGQKLVKQRLSEERLACYNLKMLSLYGERYHF